MDSLGSRIAVTGTFDRSIMEYTFSSTEPHELADVFTTMWLDNATHAGKDPCAVKWECDGATGEQIHTYLKSRHFAAPDEYRFEQYKPDTGIISGHHVLVRWSLNDTVLKLQVFYHREHVAKVNGLREAFRPIDVSKQVKWAYRGTHGVVYEDLLLTGKDPTPEFYPWIPDLQKFYEEFTDSTANVLLLIGPPGTGKTTFIRGLLRQSSMQGWVAYDPKVQGDDELYIRFAKLTTREYDEEENEVIRRGPEGRMLVLEDSDDLLSARSEGNDLMSRLLNLSDGLVTIPQRKFVFSTNLPSLNSVDPALLRPGRCFAVVNFRALNGVEAHFARESAGLPERDFLASDRIILSEALNDKQVAQASTVRKVGFA
jgi:hypothetical protein